MKVLVDTCIWSQVLRHRYPNQEITSKLKDLIADGRISIIDPIRQEILSGISDDKQFRQLENQLAFFEDVPIVPEHFIKAAKFCNICRRSGIQGSSTDFLICAVASVENLYIYTSDQDFDNYTNCLAINLY